MKNMRKLASVLLVLVMLFALAVPVAAASITIKGGASGSEYAAYKLLNATDGGEGKFAYTLNEKYTSILQAVTGKTTETDIVAYISEIADKSGAVQKFADDVYAKIVEAKLEADKTTSTNTFSDVDQGYYLIAETKVGSDEDTFSLVMLDTAGKDDITVETKEELPESKKKVKDANDSTGAVTEWQDSADHDIGDKVPFQITFTLPSDFANYESYFVGIHDIQAAGLTYNNDLKVTVNGIDITGWFTYSAATDDGCTFHIACRDIIAEAKAKNVTLNAGDKIVFEYTSTLNEKAEFGATGNPNEMTVEFSNNPYGDGTSKTPKDKVIVFTYKLNVDKYAGEVKDGNELTGAGFTLYKEVPSTTVGAQTGADIKKGLAENVKADALADEKYYIVISNVTTDAAGDTFTFNGVDDGDYVLVETAVPAGYNAWDAVAFTISAEHDTTSDNPTLTSLTGGDLVTGEFKDTGIIDTDIVNMSGTELPETGGMGTTLFYVVGGIMMLAAVVLLVTKKRMSAEK